LDDQKFGMDRNRRQRTNGRALEWERSMSVNEGDVKESGLSWDGGLRDGICERITGIGALPVIRNELVMIREDQARRLGIDEKTKSHTLP
jgi:hypothetical protein